jgi:hypothetical protein
LGPPDWKEGDQNDGERPVGQDIFIDPIPDRPKDKEGDDDEKDFHAEQIRACRRHPGDEADQSGHGKANSEVPPGRYFDKIVGWFRGGCHAEAVSFLISIFKMTVKLKTSKVNAAF